MNAYEKRIILATGILLIMNLFDEYMTFWGLNLMVIEEANPLMQGVIAKDPSKVMITKLLLPVFLGVLCWLARERSQRLIKYSLSLVLVVYLLIDLMHFYWLLNL